MAHPLVVGGEPAVRHGDRLHRITPREWQVLVLMAQGRSNIGIAAALVLSHSAVAKHINSIFTKLGLPTTDHDNRRVLAVLRLLRATGGHVVLPPPDDGRGGRNDPRGGVSVPPPRDVTEIANAGVIGVS